MQRLQPLEHPPQAFVLLLQPPQPLFAYASRIPPLVLLHTRRGFITIDIASMEMETHGAVGERKRESEKMDVGATRFSCLNLVKSALLSLVKPLNKKVTKFMSSTGERDGKEKSVR
ncbi:hypothetical protein Bca4012_005288 [Brassica carinata]